MRNVRPIHLSAVIDGRSAGGMLWGGSFCSARSADANASADATSLHSLYAGWGWTQLHEAVQSRKNQDFFREVWRPFSAATCAASVCFGP